MTIARKLHWIFNVSCTLSSRNFLRKKEFSVQGLAIVIIVNKIGFSTRSDLSYAIVHRYILLGVSCFALYSQRLGSTLRSNEQPSLIFLSSSRAERKRKKKPHSRKQWSLVRPCFDFASAAQLVRLACRHVDSWPAGAKSDWIQSIIDKKTVS